MAFVPDSYWHNIPVSKPGSRHAFYYAHCDVHGDESEHLTGVGCVPCAQAKEKDEGEKQ